jgi:hypothetical protein
VTAANSQGFFIANPRGFITANSRDFDFGPTFYLPEARFCELCGGPLGKLTHRRVTRCGSCAAKEARTTSITDKPLTDSFRAQLHIPHAVCAKWGTTECLKCEHVPPPDCPARDTEVFSCDVCQVPCECSGIKEGSDVD